MHSRKIKMSGMGHKMPKVQDRNHFAKVCRTSKKTQHPDASIKQIETEEASDSDSSDVDFITSTTTTISAVILDAHQHLAMRKKFTQ